MFHLKYVIGGSVAKTDYASSFAQAQRMAEQHLSGYNLIRREEIKSPGVDAQKATPDLIEVTNWKFHFEQKASITRKPMAHVLIENRDVPAVDNTIK